MSEVVCGICDHGLLFAAQNRRKYLNAHGWMRSRKFGWIHRLCNPKRAALEGRA